MAREPDMAPRPLVPHGGALADGRIPIMSGLDETGTDKMDTDVEVFTPPSALGADDASVDLIGNTTETAPYDGPWTGGYYPQMYRDALRSCARGRPAEGADLLPQAGRLRDPQLVLAHPAEDPPDMSTRHIWGTGVPLPGGIGGSTRFMMIGGSTFDETIPSNGNSEIYDEAQPGLGWQTGPSLNMGRGHANTVLLPDGSMVEVGGGVGREATFASPLHATSAEDLDGDGEPDQKQVELWDPAPANGGSGRRRPRTGPTTRLRCSCPTAACSPPGTSSTTRARAPTRERSTSPPTCSRGRGPRSRSAPAAIKLGSGFGVGTPDSNVTKAVLVAPGAVTHAVNMSQRRIPLELTKRTNCVDLTAPPSANAAPPGYYMLFLLNDRGVPSIAKFVKLTTGGAAPSKCADRDPAGGPAGGSAGRSRLSSRPSSRP